MEKVAVYLTKYILLHGVIKKEDYLIYKYGLQTGIELLLCIITNIIIAAYMGKIWESLLLMSIFFIQRAYIAGIHMKQFCFCYFISCGVVILGIEFLGIVIVPLKIAILTIVVCLCMIYKLNLYFSLKTPENKTQEYFLKYTKCIIMFIASLSIIFFLFHYKTGVYIIMYSELIMLLSSGIKFLIDKLLNKHNQKI